MFEKLKAHFPSENLTPGVRILATTIALINLPAFVIAVCFFFFIIPIPGIVFFVFTVLIAANRVSLPAALFVSIAGVLFDLILFGSLVVNKGMDWHEPMSWAVYGTLLATVGLGSLNVRMMLEKNREALQKPIVEVHEEVLA